MEKNKNISIEELEHHSYVLRQHIEKLHYGVCVLVNILEEIIKNNKIKPSKDLLKIIKDYQKLIKGK